MGGKEYDDLKQIRLVRIDSQYQGSIRQEQPITMASICVKRNIIFGSKVYSQEAITSRGYVKTTMPLLKKALAEASREGDQPQGLAALHGLSRYVREALEREGLSPALEGWRNRTTQTTQSTHETDENQTDHVTTFLAMSSVATQIPRKGHTVVGIGTYSDARKGWTDLAKEYATIRPQSDDERYSFVREGDAQLFQSMGGFLVNIEYIGMDENPDYWKDAGGAMARFFFL